MYLWQDILADQDQSPRWKSSLPEIFSKSGCISPPEIIPPRHFQQIRMHFPAGNHPSKTFPANQDAFLRWKSSLTDFSSKSGCISPTGIIPHRHFQPIRMNPIERNHLWTSILANQDEFPPLKKRPSKSLSSLRDRQSTLDKGYNSFREKFNEKSPGKWMKEQKMIGYYRKINTEWNKIDEQKNKKR